MSDVIKLRLHIDGQWDSIDFSILFLISDGTRPIVPTVRQVSPDTANRANYAADRPHLLSLLSENATKIVRPKTAGRTEVRRFSYGSRGITDLVGVAGILRELRLMIQFSTICFLGRNDRKQLSEIRGLRIRALREQLEAMSSIKDYIRNDFGTLSMSEIENQTPDFDRLIESLQMDILAKMAAENKLLGAEEIGDDRP